MKGGGEYGERWCGMTKGAFGPGAHGDAVLIRARAKVSRGWQRVAVATLVVPHPSGLAVGPETTTRTATTTVLHPPPFFHNLFLSLSLPYFSSIFLLFSLSLDSPIYTCRMNVRWTNMCMHPRTKCSFL